MDTRTAIRPVYPQPPGPESWVLLSHVAMRRNHSSISKHLLTGILRETHTLVLGEYGFGRSDTVYYHPRDPEEHHTLQAAIESAKRLRLI